MTLRVVEPGLFSLIVDLGRNHHRSLGLSRGGAADRAAYMQGNALVGNFMNEAAIEFAGRGPTLISDNQVSCSIFGAPVEAWIDQNRISSDTVFNLRANEKLRIGGVISGFRGYLCIAGGISSPPSLGSRTAFEPIKTCDLLDGVMRLAPKRGLAYPVSNVFQRNQCVTLRCVAGPQSDTLDLSGFYSQQFRVSSSSDRMGIRLSGFAVEVPRHEIASEAVCPGTVQVLNAGQCVILGVDAQTIGGYPKIACVISADIDRIGHLAPGQSIQFEQVTMDEAEVAYRQYMARIENNLMRLRLR